MRRIVWLRIRRFESLLMAFVAISAMAANWAATPTRAAAAVVPAVVTIEWHDGNADQIDALSILDGHSMHATFLVNTGPILAQDPAKLSVAQLQTIYGHVNEIAGHTLDHVNVQPLPQAEARREVCTDRNNLLDMGSSRRRSPTRSRRSTRGVRTWPTTATTMMRVPQRVSRSRGRSRTPSLLPIRTRSEP